jgi:hypothetical protein
MTINNSNVVKLDANIGKASTSMVTTNIANIEMSKEFAHLQLFTMSLQNLDLDIQEYIFLCQQVFSSLKKTLADVVNFFCNFWCHIAFIVLMVIKVHFKLMKKFQLPMILFSLVV